MKTSFIIIAALLLGVAWANPDIIPVNAVIGFNTTSNSLYISIPQLNINANYSGNYIIQLNPSIASGFNSITFNGVSYNTISVSNSPISVANIISPQQPIFTRNPTSVSASIGESPFTLNGLGSLSCTDTSCDVGYNYYTIIPPSSFTINLGSFNPSWNNTVPISESRNSISVTGTINQISKLGISKTFNPSFLSKGFYNNSTYGINITVNKIAPLGISANIIPSFISNYSIINKTEGINITVNKIPPLNIKDNITPSFTTNFSYINSTEGINITVNKMPSLNLSKTVVPSFTSNFSYLNSTDGVNIIVSKVPPLNINKTLESADSYINKTYGIYIYASPITANMLTGNDLIQYYNNQVRNSCLSWINFTSDNKTYSICARASGQNNYSITDICPALATYGNVSSGLAGCVGQFAQLANQSAQEWHKQYLLTYGALQSNITLLQAYTNGSAQGQAYAQTFENVIGAILAIVVLYEFVQIVRRRNKEQGIGMRRPVQKV